MKVYLTILIALALVRFLVELTKEKLLVVF